MKYIDLFAGIGGFRYGIERAFSIWNGQTKEGDGEAKAFEQGMESTKKSIFGNRNKPNNIISGNTGKILDCVYSSEWDKYANSVYRRHYEECDNQDIRTVNAEEIPDHDLLVGGFPCQSFSIAGKRGGFNDTRGTLFFDIARILRVKQPRLCILENVKGLLSHDEGRTFATIIATLDELGYDLQWQVLNSKNFGVPQNRERIFIVGHLRGTSRPKVFPITKDDGFLTERQGQISPTITQRYYKQGQLDPYIVTEKSEPSQPSVFKERDQSNDSDIGRGKAHTAGIRRLTPIECERLQGFPDNWTQYGADGEIISDTQRYKMCGNAVTTNVITAIAEKLLGLSSPS